MMFVSIHYFETLSTNLEHHLAFILLKSALIKSSFDDNKYSDKYNLLHYVTINCNGM